MTYPSVSIGGGGRRFKRLAVVFLLIALLLILTMASLTLGSRDIDIGIVREAMFATDPANNDHVIVWSLRVPRTMIAILTGIALGTAGALTQAITRNPLAEPGLLGVNAGAATAVIFGIAIFGLRDIQAYVWLGFLGAFLSATAVIVLGNAHRGAHDPIRLVLAGAGLSIILGSVTGVVVLNAPTDVLDSFRTWAAGSVEGRDSEVVQVLAIATAAGLALSFLIANELNAVGMGADLAQALGARSRGTLVLGCIAITILAGGATAAAGPIAFLGLIGPQIMRRFVGPDCRWLIPISGLVGASFLLLADIVGRVIAAPEEVAAGIVVLVIGGPIFVLAARNLRIRQW